MAAKNRGLGPWSGYDVHIQGEPKAKDALRKRRAALEEIVAPYVTTSKTDLPILFQSKRRYLKRSSNKVWRASHALQFLYDIETASKVGDIDKLIRAAVGFGTADYDVKLIEGWGVGSVEAAVFRARTKRKRRETREGNRKLKDVPDIILQSAYASHREKRDWLKQVTREIRDCNGKPVSSKTVRTELRNRGILE